MTAEEIANSLDEMFGEQTKQTDELEEDVAKLILAWDRGLSPVKKVMEKYSMLFKNPYVKGGNLYGIVVGEDADGTPLILRGGLIARFDSSNDRLDINSRITVQNFIHRRGEIEKTLSVIKAGFDYVRKMKCVNENPIAERNKPLKAFLEENAG